MAHAAAAEAEDPRRAAGVLHHARHGRRLATARWMRRVALWALTASIVGLLILTVRNGPWFSR